MKKSLVLFLALLYYSLCFGQNIPDKANISWSKEIRGKRKMTASQIIGGDESGVYVTKTTIKDNVRGNNSLPILEQYDKNFRLIKSEELKVVDKEGRLIYENIFQMDGNLYLFYSLVNIWKQSITLMLQPLDKRNLRLTGNAKKIMETKIPAITQRDQLTNFGFEFSNDNYSLLLFHTVPSSGNKPETVKLYVFGQDMNLDWSKEVTLPYKNKLFEPKDFYLDNNKNVYLLGKKYHKTKTDKKSGKPNFNFVLLSYFNKGADSKTHEITAEGRFFTDMKIAVNQHSEIICSGFYSNEGNNSIGRLADIVQKNTSAYYKEDNNSSIRGSYYLKLEPGTHQIKRESYNDFTVDFLTQNMTDKKTRKTIKKIKKGNQPEMYSYKLDNLIIREDGSITLVGEQMEEIKVRRTSQFTQPGVRKTSQFTKPGSSAQLSSIDQGTYTTLSDHYSYQDIIVVRFSPEGEFEWSEKIAKKQKTSSDFGFFSSYIMAKGKDKTYFIFNDNPKNLHYKGTGKLANFNPRSKKDFLVVLVTLDSKGNKSKEVVSLRRDSNVLIKPTASKQISSNQLIVFGQFKKNSRFAKLEFEDTFSY